MCIPHFVYLLICRWTLGWFSLFGSFESLLSIDLNIQEWIFQDIWQVCVFFFLVFIYRAVLGPVLLCELQLWQAGATAQLQCTCFSLKQLLVAHILQNAQASVVVSCGHSSCGTWTTSSCPAACGIFIDQVLNLCLLALAGRFFTTEPQGKPGSMFYCQTFPP